MAKKFLLFSVIILAAVLITTSQRAKGEGIYVGSETCMECHEESYDSYMKNYHAVKGDPRTPGAKQECESCHGPGAIHAEEEGEGPIISLSPKSATPVEEKNAPCLRCHTKGKLVLWHGSTHEGRGLSCSNCHNPHQEYPKGFSKPTQTEVCTQCHKRIRAELLRQSHHPIREGKMECSDCHNSHGTIADKLVDAQYGSLKCFECHANLRGPLLWEHPPVVENCLTCHTPHGSPRTPLLKAKMPYLCQRCHSNVGHPSQLQARSASESGQSVYRVLNNRGFYRACLNCHVQVHGSNHPSGKSLMR
jgi:DmsE family decaheme c-type cytochrome